MGIATSCESATAPVASPAPCSSTLSCCWPLPPWPAPSTTRASTTRRRPSSSTPPTATTRRGTRTCTGHAHPAPSPSQDHRRRARLPHRRHQHHQHPRLHRLPVHLVALHRLLQLPHDLPLPLSRPASTRRPRPPLRRLRLHSFSPPTPPPTPTRPALPCTVSSSGTIWNADGFSPPDGMAPVNTRI